MSVRFACFVTAAVALSTAASASVVYVKADAVGLDDGSSWANAFRDLDSALSVATSGDQIWIAAGSYYPPSISIPFELPSGVRLYGGFAGGEAALDDRDWVANLCVLDGDFLLDDQPGFLNRADNARVLLSINNGSLGTRVDGLVFRGGYADGTTGPSNGGGAIRLWSGNVTIENCLFISNASEIGGAIYANMADEVRIRNTVFTLNQTLAGGSGHGGAVTLYGASVLIEGCNFSLNSAQNTSFAAGGGAYLNAESIEINDSRFSFNIVDGSGAEGGGLYLDQHSGFAQVTGCIFNDNWAQAGTSGLGGAISADSQSTTGGLLLADCQFLTNQATGSTVANGGAIVTTAPQLDVVGCSFIGNSSRGGTAGFGGAVNHEAALGPPLSRVVGCQFLGNASDDAGAFNMSSASDVALLKMVDSVVAGNTGHDSSSAIRVDGQIDLDNCTIAYNSASDDANAAAVVFSAEDGLQIDNTIIWGTDAMGTTSIASQIAGPATAGSVNHSCITDWPAAFGGLGNVDADPLFFDPDGADDILGNEDDLYTLRRFSPCIDSGGNSAVPEDFLDLDADGNMTERIPLDVYGRNRRADDIDVPDTGSGLAPIVDIGAVELQLRSCPADLAFDGQLDFFDVQEFLNRYASGDLSVDFTFDGTLDFFDVLAFLAFFDAGCP